MPKLYDVTATAPGPQSNGQYCAADCESTFAPNYFPGAGPDFDIAPSAQVFTGQVAAETRTVTKAGNCVGVAAITAAGIDTPKAEDGLTGYLQDKAVDKGVDKGGEFAAKRAEKLARFGGNVGKGAKLAGKVAGKAGHIFTVYQTGKALYDEGCFSGWSQQ